MKGGFAAAALAAMVGGANAINHRHAHELFAHKRGDVAQTCGCTTIWTTTTGEATLVPVPPPATPTTTAAPKPTTTSTVKLPIPTPEPITCPTPGTYTIPATTVTLTKPTTVCVGSSTHVPSGTHTVGGVTTIVETATTVTCPVATTTTLPDGVVTSTVVSTEYVCPTAGTYTIAPITTTVTEDCDIEIPIPTSYDSGVYTAPEQILTITETGFVTVCPYTTSKAPKPTTQPPPPPPKPTKEAPPVVELPEIPEIPEIPEKPSNGGHFDGSFGGDNDHYGITYTPYDGQTGECKSSSQVEKDLKEIKNDGFQVLRIYSTDCDTLESVGSAAKKHGLQLIIGVFVKESGCSYDSPDIKEQVDAIANWAAWDITKLFVVGNEAIMNGFCTPSELKELVKTVKSKCSGYTGPVTIAETLAQWLDPEVAGTLCDAIDFTGANIHPFFNAENLASLAGIFVQGQLEILDGICPGKEAVNLECGWPTGGNCIGSACPGESEQAEALQSIRDVVGGRTVFFSFENDAWKEPGDTGCEQFWGAKDYFKGL